MPHLILALLGAPEVRYGPQTLTFATRKTLALLIYLAVEAGRHPREKLATLFWPESDTRRARGALRTTLAHLRQALDTATSPGSQAYLTVEADACGFIGQSEYELDLHILAAAATDEPSETLAAAAQRYRGDFLEGFTLPDAPAFDRWTALQRERWQHQASVVFDRLSRWQSERRDFAGGIATAVQWLGHDPLNEAAHRRLMQLHALAGNRAAALQAYQAGRDLLAAELGAEPSPETARLLKHIQNMKPERRPPAPGAGDGRVATDRSLRPSSLADPPFVGRNAEHRQLVSAYHAASQGQTQTVVIAGEAGIGKTRLAGEFLAWAAVEGADVVSGRAFEAGGRLPYQPWVEALRQRLDQENAPDDLLSDVWLVELSRLLPELRDRYPDLPAPPKDSEPAARTRLLEAVVQTGRALAARSPVVVFMDDIQWADAASLDVLRYGGRAWMDAHTPLLLLLSVRSEALATTPALNDWITGLERDVALTRLALGPISAAETQQLVAALHGSAGVGERGGSPHAPAWFAQWLFDETAGQPFYISEMIKTLVDRGLVHVHATETGVWTVQWPLETQPARPPPGLVPPGVRELILTRLRRLSADARALLTAAAILGRAGGFDLICQVAALPASLGLPALDELLTMRLLLETEDFAHPYMLAHDKIRDVVYTEAGAARRGLFHQRALAGLEAMAAPPAELAFHALAARLTEPAIRFSLAAGDAALAVFAVPDAIAHYEHARRQWSAGRDPHLEADALLSAESRQHLYLRLGRAYELSGDYEPAQTIYREMLAWAQASDLSDSACLALNRLGTLATHAYEFEAAADWLNQARAAAQTSGAGLLAETELSLAQLAYHTFDYPATRRHSQQSLALARELNNPELIAGSLNTLAYAEALLGQARACHAHMEEAKRIYAALGNRALEVDCLTIMAVVNLWQGHLATSLADARTAHAISQAIGNPWGQIHSSSVLAGGLLDQGDYGEALRVAEQGRQLAPGHDLVLVSLLNLLILGAVHRATLDMTAAQAVHLEAAKLIEATPSALLAEMAAAELCADFALAGAWPEAGRYAREALASRQYDAVPLLVSPHWLETEALLRCGEVDQAREDARRWGKLVGHLPRYRLAHLRSQAVLAGWEGDQKRAIALFEEAQALAEDIGLPGEQWPILAALAQLYPEAAQRQAAKDEAAQIITHLAAQIEADEVLAGFLRSAG
ncbi:MAG: AAA family ATPase [Anaerolineales bacterium]|nr:AAA family ATPase [Anaerolineales bacterium]